MTLSHDIRQEQIYINVIAVSLAVLLCSLSNQEAWRCSMYPASHPWLHSALYLVSRKAIDSHQ